MIVTLDKAAEMFGLTRESFQCLVGPSVPSYKLGPSTLFELADLLRWWSSNKGRLKCTSPEVANIGNFAQRWLTEPEFKDQRDVWRAGQPCLKRLSSSKQRKKGHAAALAAFNSEKQPPDTSPSLETNVVPIKPGSKSLV